MTKLHIDISGSGSPLIMLHGWGWNSQIWEPLLPQLQNKYQVFRVDLPGFGKSPVLTKDYNFESIVLEILTLVPEKAAWLGWSLGGLFAMWTAIYFPHRVTQLITVASSPRFISDENWPGIEIFTLEKFSKLLMKDYKKTLFDFLELQLRGSPQREHLFSQLSEKLLRENNENTLTGLVGGLNLLSRTDLRAEIKNIHCPSLHIFGQRDTIVPMSIATVFPKSQTQIIKNTGHMPFLTHTELFLDLLNRFEEKIQISLYTNSFDTGVK